MRKHQRHENQGASHRLASNADVVLIAANPKAGARSGRPRVERLKEALEPAFEVQVLTDIEQLAAAARSYLASGRLRTVVAAGGDGTFSLVARRTPPGTPLTILPMGTENLLARYTRSPRRPEGVAELIRETGVVVALDAGQVGDHLFMLMAGVGFDAEVVRQVHSARRGNINRWAYAKPILDCVRRYKYPKLKIYYGAEARRRAELAGRECPPANRSSEAEAMPTAADAAQTPADAAQTPADAAQTPADAAQTPADAAQAPAAREAQAVTATDGNSAPPALGSPSQPICARWGFIVNLPRYAGGLQLVPGACGTDGQLDLCAFTGGSLWNGIRYLWGVFAGQHLKYKDCISLRADRFWIESTESVPYQLDGDPGGALPIEIRVLPGRVRIVVSASQAARLRAVAPSEIR